MDKSIEESISTNGLFRYPAVTVPNPLAAQLVMGRKKIIIRKEPLKKNGKIFKGEIFIISAKKPVLPNYEESAVLGKVDIVNTVKVADLPRFYFAQHSNYLESEFESKKNYYAHICKNAERVVEMPAEPMPGLFWAIFPNPLVYYNYGKKENKAREFSKYKIIGYSIMLLFVLLFWSFIYLIW